MARFDLIDYLMGRDKAAPLSPQLEANMLVLLSRVNALLDEAIPQMADQGLHYVAEVSSGYRPEPFNSKVGGSKNSAHLTCEAVDLKDRTQLLGRWLRAHPQLLETHDLYMEDPVYTSTWVHLQTRKTPSGKRIFIPK